MPQKLWHFNPVVFVDHSKTVAKKESTYCFPFKFRPGQSYKGGSRYFGANRSNGRKHAGCDLIAPVGTEVYAVDDGIVIQNMYRFYEHVNALEISYNFV